MKTTAADQIGDRCRGLNTSTSVPNKFGWSSSRGSVNVLIQFKFLIKLNAANLVLAGQQAFTILDKMNASNNYTKCC